MSSWSSRLARWTARPGDSLRSRLVIIAVVLVAYLAWIDSVGVNTGQGSVLMLIIPGALFALAMGVSYGWCGLVTFGQGAFFSMGGFTAALLREKDLSPLLVILLGGLIGGVAAWIFAALVLRRSTSLWFAMLTLAFGQFLFEYGNTSSHFGGPDGIAGIPRGSVFGYDLTMQWPYTVFSMAVVAVVLPVLAVIYVSGFGMAGRAARLNGRRAEALGLNVVMIQVTMFGVSGAVSGIAGVLLAQQQSFFSTGYLSLQFAGAAIVAAMIGGVHSYWGPLIGFTILSLAQNQLAGSTLGSVGWDLVLGVAVILIVLIASDGLMGGLESALRSVRRRLLRARGSSLPPKVPDRTKAEALEGGS